MPSRQMNSILAALDRHVRYFDLDRNDLAEDLMDIATEEIRRSMDAETDPDGNPWPALSGDYAKWKAKHFPGNPMAVLHGVMKTDAQLRGNRNVAPDRCRMTYGLDQRARDEATWFQEGPPERRFWGLSAAAITRMNARLDRHFRRLR